MNDYTNIDQEEIFDLPSGPELTLAAARGDLLRVAEFLSLLTDNPAFQNDDNLSGLIADVENVRELLSIL